MRPGPPLHSGEPLGQWCDGLNSDMVRAPPLMPLELVHGIIDGAAMSDSLISGFTRMMHSVGSSISDRPAVPGPGTESLPDRTWLIAC